MVLNIEGIPEVATAIRVRVAAPGGPPWAFEAQPEPDLSFRVDVVPAGLVIATAEALVAGTVFSAATGSATVQPETTDSIRLDLSRRGRSYEFTARASVLARLADATRDRLEVSLPLSTATHFADAEAALGGPPNAAEVRSFTVSLALDRSTEVQALDDVWAGEVLALVGGAEVGRATPEDDALELEWVSARVLLPEASAANLRQGTIVRLEGTAADDDPDDVGALEIAIRLALSR